MRRRLLTCALPLGMLFLGVPGLGQGGLPQGAVHKERGLRVPIVAAVDKEESPAEGVAMPTLFNAAKERAITDEPRGAHWGEALLGVWSVDLDGSLLARPQQGESLAVQQRIAVDLPQEPATRILRLGAVQHETNGTFSRTGVVEGDEGSLVALTTGRQGMIGRIHTKGRIYLIEAAEDAQEARMSLIDPARLPGAASAVSNGQAAAPPPVPDVPMLFEGLKAVTPDAARAERWGDALLGFYDIDLKLQNLHSSTRVRPLRRAPVAPVAGLRVGAYLPFAEGPVVLNLTTIEQNYLGGIQTSWSGWVEGDEEGSLATLTVGPSGTLGRIHFQGWLYLIEGDGGQHTLSVLGRLPHPDGTAPMASAAPASASHGVVRVLVLHSPAVAGQINTLAGNIVAEFNQALGLSGVAAGNRLSLAGVQQVSDDFTTTGARCKEQILGQLANRQGVFSDVDTRMSDTHADIALLVVSNRPDFSECLPSGAGRIGGSARVFDSTAPFALTTELYALGDLTALHEIGHVFGGRHESGSAPATPSYARGHSATGGAWQTVMGGYLSCPFDVGQPDPALQPTRRLPRFSNPLKTYLGQPTGTASRNMAAALEVQMPVVAAWTADPPSPASPAWLTVTSQQCAGLNDVSWAASPSADAYELHGATHPAFSAPSLMYVGPYTGAFLDVGTDTWLRAKACTGGSCSGYSPQDVASVWPGTCL